MPLPKCEFALALVGTLGLFPTSRQLNDASETSAIEVDWNNAYFISVRITCADGVKDSAHPTLGDILQE